LEEKIFTIAFWGIDHEGFLRISLLELDCCFFQFGLERTRLIAAQNLVFRIFLRAKPRGPTAESSAILERALGCRLSIRRKYSKRRFFGTMGQAFVLAQGNFSLRSFYMAEITDIFIALAPDSE